MGCVLGMDLYDSNEEGKKDAGIGGRRDSRSFSILRLMGYSALTTIIFLVGLELLLRLLPNVEVYAQRGRPDETASDYALVILGDSVSFGFGLDRGEDYGSILALRSMENSGARVICHNLAVPGGTIEEEARAFETHDFRPGVKYVVLLMAGHNGFVKWQQLLRNNGGSGRFLAEASSSGQSLSPWSALKRLKLVRALRWLWGALRDEGPRRDFSPEVMDSYKRQVDKIAERVRSIDGRFYMLTYLVPGDPSEAPIPADLRANTAVIRDIQIDINRFIRQTSRDKGIPLIDIERLVDAPDAWDPRYFQDSIHPTAHAHRLIADAIHERLLSDGGLPAEAID